MDEHQRADLDAHLAEPFPASVEKGEVYGVVDPVLVGEDIVGYVSHGRLDPVRRRSLREIADQLTRSLDAFPKWMLARSRALLSEGAAADAE